MSSKEKLIVIYVIPNMYEILSFVEHKIIYLDLDFLVHAMKVNDHQNGLVNNNNQNILFKRNKSIYVWNGMRVSK